MKNWPDNHPKAKLMARKRAAILEAAQHAFLRDGYEGTSMDRIAAEAGVSIMTLYRHAEGKDKLFASVIATACHPSDQAEQAKLDAALQKSLCDILVFVGLMFQERVFSPTTTGLLRVVMMETSRHPQLADLAQIAYNGLLTSHADRLYAFLESRPEAGGLPADRLRTLATGFLDRLVGIDTFAVLLRLHTVAPAIRLARAEVASAELLAALPGHP